MWSLPHTESNPSRSAVRASSTAWSTSAYGTGYIIPSVPVGTPRPKRIRPASTPRLVLLPHGCGIWFRYLRAARAISPAEACVFGTSDRKTGVAGRRARRRGAAAGLGYPGIRRTAHGPGRAGLVPPAEHAGDRPVLGRRRGASTARGGGGRADRGGPRAAGGTCGRRHAVVGDRGARRARPPPARGGTTAGWRAAQGGRPARRRRRRSHPAVRGGLP